MYFKILMLTILALVITSCGHNHDHENQEEHDHQKNNQDDHEDIKIQYTSYSLDFELFAEADLFVVEETANVLSHFSELPEFRAVESASITMSIIIDGKETKQTLDKPTRKGIYNFNIKPKDIGQGTLKFKITNEEGEFEIIVPDINVFASQDEAHNIEAIIPSMVNTSIFTKEQSWKIDFSTGYPSTEAFEQIIKATALAQSAQSNEIVVTAKTNGIITIANNNLIEGQEVSKAQKLFSISGSEFADNNFSVQYNEARNNFEKAKADYDRAKVLSEDNIISEKNLLEAKNLFENSKAIYDNLNTNFSSNGQNVKSPMNGFVKQIFIKNGSYVETGQPILTISQNNTLVLIADVAQKYASVLGNVYTATIHTLYNKQTYTFEQLNGKVLSYGKSVNSDNYLIPVTLQIDNKANFIEGSFVEVYLKTFSKTQRLTIPNSSLLEEQGNYFVYVQITPELFEKRHLTIGETDGINTEILKGISKSERIVTKGGLFIKLAQATQTIDTHSGHVH